MAKGAIMGALNRYLDFINMFACRRQLFGNREYASSIETPMWGPAEAGFVAFAAAVGHARRSWQEHEGDCARSLREVRPPPPPTFPAITAIYGPAV